MDSVGSHVNSSIIIFVSMVQYIATYHLDLVSGRVFSGVRAIFQIIVGAGEWIFGALQQMGNSLIRSTALLCVGF